MRNEYFINTQDHEYKVVIGKSGEYPRFNFFVKDGDKWSSDLIVNDNIWENLGVNFMNVLTNHLSENNISGYSFVTNDEQRLIVYERFLDLAGYDLTVGKPNIITPKII